jgi:tetratricopeptide (TPR) repeat protein
MGDVPDRDREARIEELLLTGLTHYFADQHDLAINVWTRVLFIDRGHAKARAYIERARSAIAERQREGDELLFTSSAALDRGDAHGARELVRSAVERGASSEDALALLARIDRLESAGRADVPRDKTSTAGSAHGSMVSAGSRFRRWQWITAGLLAGIIMGAGAIVVLAQRGATGWPFTTVTEGPQPALGAPVPVPSAAEVVLSRAEALYARGRLHEALEALDAIAASDPLRPRADQIASEIQKQLLSGIRTRESTDPNPLRRP